MCLPVNREKNIKSSSSLKHQEIYLGTNRIKRDWSQDLFFFEPKEKLHYFINFSNCRLCASYFYKMVHLFSPMLLYSVNFRDEDLSLLFDIFSKYIIYEHKMWVDILFLFFQLSPVLYNLFQIELFIASNALLHEFFFHIYLLRCFFLSSVSFVLLWFSFCFALAVHSILFVFSLDNTSEQHHQPDFFVISFIIFVIILYQHAHLWLV